MKNYILLLAVLFLISFSINAQEVETDNKNGSKIQGTEKVNTPQAVTDEIKFKNETGNAIIAITDEGNNIGSITLPSTATVPATTTNKLYNISGVLNFNGVPLTTGASGTTYAVGDFAQGGIVFWVDETAQHGLVCAKEDQNSGSTIRWYAGTITYTMAKGDGPFSGEMNTTLIIANQGYGDGNTYAARVCSELQITEGSKTYGDWYLPSKQELNLMYINKATINTTATTNSGSNFQSDYYWSSTEVIDLWVARQSFDNGSQGNYGKSLLFYMRAVRAF